MFKHINENTIWTTYEGAQIRFRDLEDTHIANILHFRKHSWNNEDSLCVYLRKMAKERGLTEEFLKRAPYPYKNMDNRWTIWTSKKGFHSLQD